MSPVRLEENIFNRAQAPHQPKFKIWASAGLMLSYWCPSRCRCCYVFAGPDAAGSASEMTARQAVAYWAGIVQLAGPRGNVHITGGEPFGDFERLKHILQLARHKGMEGLEKIETNAYWCTSDELVYQRLSQLKELGLTKLQVSCDIYHQEYIPIENVQRALRIGLEVLGRDRIQIRWQDFLDNPVLVGPMSPETRASAIAETLKNRPERLLGRAAEELSTLLYSRNCDDFVDKSCFKEILAAKHVHIDGAGHVFSGTCMGIILGKLVGPQDDELVEFWRSFDYRLHPVWSILGRQGPMGLLALAEPLGYQRRTGYVDKCHLCYDLRQFLYKKGEFKGYLGPGNCYGMVDFGKR